MKQLLCILLSLCSVAVLASLDHPLGFYGVPSPDLRPDGVYYETYGPDLGPYGPDSGDGFKKYSYDYGVSDPHTGDHKKVWESAYGNGVKGGYSLIEPDGTERIVEYIADDVNGFNAVVKRVGPAHHPIPSYGVEGPVVPVVIPYKKIYNPLYKNGFYGPGAYSYQNIEQYH